MRAMALAAALVAVASFSSHADESTCLSIEAAKANILASGGTYLGVGKADPISVVETLGADRVIVAVMDGYLWRLPVDAAGCVSTQGFFNVDDIET